ncbi:MAG: hypothetical protein JO073_00895, partial [Actinobacteria bacterium]|nr:hypothetical protein [Actinomycetota bacterium]
AVNGFGGNLLDLQVNGSSKLSVDKNGNLTAAGGATIGGSATISGSAALNGGASITGTLRQTGSSVYVSSTPQNYTAPDTFLATDLLTNRIAVVNAGSGTMSLPTAANLISVGGLSNGDTFAFLIANTTGSDITVGGNTGTAISGNGTVTAGGSRVFYCRDSGGSIACY